MEILLVLETYRSNVSRTVNRDKQISSLLLLPNISQHKLLAIIFNRNKTVADILYIVPWTGNKIPEPVQLTELLLYTWIRNVTVYWIMQPYTLRDFPSPMELTPFLKARSCSYYWIPSTLEFQSHCSKSGRLLYYRRKGTNSASYNLKKEICGRLSWSPRIQVQCMILRRFISKHTFVLYEF